MSRELVLSKRMQSVADRVSSGLILADVGCDHGYLSIWLCQTGRIPSAIAMDVNEGPLLRARQNVELYGLQDRISFRLSDGLTELKSHEVQSVAIAGMGGMLIIRILKARPDLLEEISELILEPQSDAEGVRSFLGEIGFVIVDEDLVLEDGKFYPVIKAVSESDTERENCSRDSETAAGVSADKSTLNGKITVDTEEDIEKNISLKFGRILLMRRHPVLKMYLEKNLDQTKDLIRRLEEKATEKGLARAEELKKEVQYMETALHYYR
ncbi:MAG: class I SAM-dependent methyltransferase [Lachnospiraceae bacterium]|nr:class I SAM-dependent methyltransferase [Lachnospiraceae bacterium]